MSDLREALEKRLSEPYPKLWHENGFRVNAVPEAWLRELLAAHPAEPAPDLQDWWCPVADAIEGPRGGFDVCCDAPEKHVSLTIELVEKSVRAHLSPAPVGVEITDEAVAAAADAYGKADNYGLIEHDEYQWARSMRAALEAALPHLGAHLPNRHGQSVELEISEEEAALYREQMQDWMPQPFAARERVAEVLRKHLVDSNFASDLHEPIRTQAIDQWVDVLTGSLLAPGVFRDEAEVKAEVLREIRNEIGVEQDDPTIQYVTVQIGRGTWAELEASRG